MQKPRVFIVQEDEDANIILSGMLCLKGIEALSSPQEKIALK
jgi:hypothetical protein